MATYMGRDTAKLKGKGGKWKYMSEAEMLSIAAKFSPYRYVCIAPISGPLASNQDCCLLQQRST